MKLQKLTLMTAAAAIALPAMVMASAGADANGDGMLNLTEVQAVFPGITEEIFIQLDVNADGMLDADEVAAAQGAGVLPKTEG